MFTFDPPKPAKRRSPAQENSWYASTPATTTKAGRTEQGWFASSHELAQGLEIDEVEEVDEETVRRLFGDKLPP